MTDETTHHVRCTVCDYHEIARSKTHAYALGRKHYHGQGHPVTHSEVVEA